MEEKKFKKIMDDTELQLAKIKDNMFGHWCNVCFKDYDKSFIKFRNKHFCLKCLEELRKLVRK